MEIKMILKGLKYTFLAASVMFALSGCDQDANTNKASEVKKETPVKQEVKTTESAESKNETKSKDFGSVEKNASYALGSILADDLMTNFIKANQDLGIAVDPELLKAGFLDSVAGKSLYNKEEAASELNKLQELMQKAAMDKQKKLNAENLKKGEEFLAQNAKNEGVKVTASGLQYKVNVEGTGEKVQSAKDVVKVIYTGKLIDGTVFDSNEGKDPIEFPLDGVIPGWTEGLQLMSAGSDYTFYIPSKLAYGEFGAGTIPGNSVLVFDVKLLGVTHPTDKAPAEEADKLPPVDENSAKQDSQLDQPAK